MNTREQIIEIATRLIQQKGDLGWSYADIAEEIGIKKASIHYYFPSKEGLIETATGLYITNALSLFDKTIVKNKSCLDRLQAIFDCYRTVFMESGKLCLCITLSQNSNRQNKLIFQKINSFFKTLHEKLEKILIEGVDQGQIKNNLNTSQTATILLSMLQGLLIISEYDWSPEQYDASCKEMLKLIK